VTVRDTPLHRQVEAWFTEYVAPWPELAEKQRSNYAKMGIDWRQIARERVFPHLGERLAGMTQGQEAMRAIVEPVYRLAQERLGLDFHVVFVIYVGICCGAGWAERLPTHRHWPGWPLTVVSCPDSM